MAYFDIQVTTPRKVFLLFYKDISQSRTERNYYVHVIALSVHKTVSPRSHCLPGDKPEHVDRSQPRLAVGTLQTIVDSTDCKYILEYIQWVEREIKVREREIGMIGMDR